MSDEIKKQVTARMDELMLEYAQLEQVLKVLENSGVPSKTTVFAGGRKDSLMGAVLEIVYHEKNGITPKEIVERLAKRGIDVKASGKVYTYLHRAEKDGRIVGKGSRGSRKYYAKAQGDLHNSELAALSFGQRITCPAELACTV